MFSKVVLLEVLEIRYCVEMVNNGLYIIHYRRGKNQNLLPNNGIINTSKLRAYADDKKFIFQNWTMIGRVSIHFSRMFSKSISSGF